MKPISTTIKQNPASTNNEVIGEMYKDIEELIKYIQGHETI